MSLNDKHDENAKLPMYSIDVGKMTDSNLVQLLNAKSPITFTDFGILRFVIFGLSEKAFAPIQRVPLDILYSIRVWSTAQTKKF